MQKRMAGFLSSTLSASRLAHKVPRTMLIQQLRNATMILELGPHRWVVDPMLAAAKAMPPFKVLGGGRRRNPTVELPAGSDEALATVDGVLLTHEHPDHFDAAGRAFARARSLPVWTNRVDAGHLRDKGFDARLVEALGEGWSVEVVRSKHGRGAVGWLLGPVCGYFLARDGEPSVYVTGDSILCESVLEAVERLRPEVIVAPAGSANFGVGGDILFSLDELVTLANKSGAQMVFNHLEALDHCPTTRASLRERMAREGLGERVWIPEDGERRSYHGTRSARPVVTRPDHGQAGMQKRMTALFSGA
jgi:L-ascorbate metabolism protein UlaG (beta-lactamase superfamily)